MYFLQCWQVFSGFLHSFAESGGVRPFGVSLLMAGCDDHGPQLYQIDPSGSYFAWKASAIGKNMTNAKTFLEKRYSEVQTASASGMLQQVHLLCGRESASLIVLQHLRVIQQHGGRRMTQYCNLSTC